MGIYRNVENQFVEARLVDFLSSIFRLVDTDDRRETTICSGDGFKIRRNRPIPIKFSARRPSSGNVIDDAERK